MNEHTDKNDAPPERYDDPWDFTVIWEPDSGTLPAPILHLFRTRSTVQPGQAVHRADKGHSAHYVRFVQSYVAKYHPSRVDIVATATRVIPPAEGRDTAENDTTAIPADRIVACSCHMVSGVHDERVPREDVRVIPPGSGDQPTGVDDHDWAHEKATYREGMGQ